MKEVLKNKIATEEVEQEVSVSETSPCDFICPVCNIRSTLVNVHGHFQCSNCKTVTESCCDGGET